jgi:hypothetical protein
MHQLYGDDLDVKFESHAGDPENSWLCLQYSMADYWSGKGSRVDDKVYLAPTHPHFGGLRWWFVCPHLNRRVRRLYLPLGGRHFDATLDQSTTGLTQAVIRKDSRTIAC